MRIIWLFAVVLIGRHRITPNSKGLRLYISITNSGLLGHQPLFNTMSKKRDKNKLIYRTSGQNPPSLSLPCLFESLRPCMVNWVIPSICRRRHILNIEIDSILSIINWSKNESYLEKNPTDLSSHISKDSEFPKEENNGNLKAYSWHMHFHCFAVDKTGSILIMKRKYWKRFLGKRGSDTNYQWCVIAFTW